MARILLQTASFMFVVKYVGYDYEFADVVFEKLRELKRNLVNLDSTSKKLTLNKYEIVNQEIERIRNKRLLSALEQFSLMLIDYPIPVFYSNGSSGEFSSRDLFLPEDTLPELLENNFKTLNGKSLYVNELDYMRSQNLYFRIVDENSEMSPERKEFLEKVAKSPRSLCSFALFNKNAHGAFEIIAQYPDDEAYQEEGSVSLFLQKTYNLSSTDVNRYFLPILKNLRM